MKFLVIEGNIGAGKTSLVQKIIAKRNAQILLEQFEENPFLNLFYQQPERYALSVELSFLADRYLQLKNWFEHAGYRRLTVADYYFTKSLIFAKATLTGNEYELYEKFFKIIYPSLPKPDLYVYLHTTVDKLLKNIQKRGREYENSITAKYLTKIEESYMERIYSDDTIKYLIIDVSSIDYISNESDFDLVVNTIFNCTYNQGINKVNLKAKNYSM